MGMRSELLLGAAILAGMTALPAYAQSTEGNTIETVVVSGIRQSMESAINIKRNATEIVDSIVAEDIGKFPDQNVADSLQRMTGVQITRDFGEGNTVAIRGLAQVENTINGQEVITSGGTRNLNMEDIPAELVSGVDVYKSPSANLIEGGLGGLVNIRTFRPLDFDGFKLSANARANYGSLRQKISPQGSVLVSDRWNTSIGEIGALIDVSFQRRSLTQYYEAMGNPTTNTVAIPGTTMLQPVNYDRMSDSPQRDRLGVDAAVQWRPVSNLEIFALARFTRLATYQDRAGSGATPSAANSVVGSFTTFAGTNDMATGTYTNVPITTYGVSRDIRDANQNYSVGASWTSSDLIISGSVNYLRSTYFLDYRELDLKATVPTMSVDLTTKVPSVIYKGLNMTDLSNFTVGNLSWNQNKYVSDGLASQGDVQWIKSVGPISEIDAGFRYASASNRFAPIRYNVSTGTQAATSLAYLFQDTDTKLFNNTASGVPMTREFFTAIPSYLRTQFQYVRNLLGVGSAAITPSTIGIYSLTERTTSGYLMAKFDTNLMIPIDGNFGVRVVNTNSSTDGSQTDLSTGGYKPIYKHAEYTTVLPSANIRFHLTDDLIARFAASKTVTRPDFSSLTPGLTLVPANQTGTSGNPDLKPLYATNVDLSLEYYFSKSDSVYTALFYKEVKNFIATGAVTTTIDGISYMISKPMNGSSGTVKGLEMGYTQFYDFLPGFLSGLGMQANYTYVDSVAPTSVAGYSSTLPQLSRHSFNIIGMYERGPFSARVAYNWRSKYYSTIYYGAGAVGLNPIYYKAFGWLNASINYDITDSVTLSMEANNLLDTTQSTYFSSATRPNVYISNDQEFMVGVRYKM